MLCRRADRGAGDEPRSRRAVAVGDIAALSDAADVTSDLAC
jgi:hypothetical protein